MHLDTTPNCPPRKPCLRDLHRLTTTLLPAAMVMLTPLPELERRCFEIDATHPQYREETPLVLAWEAQRRERLRGELVISVRQVQVA